MVNDGAFTMSGNACLTFPVHAGRMLARTLPLAALAALALAGCGGAAPEKNLAQLDQELIDGDNAVDPALASALEDQIMVDPALTAQANSDAVRPPARAYSAPVPADGVADAARPPVDAKGLMTTPPPTSGDALAAAEQSMTLGALAENQANSPGCAAKVQYSNAWAGRLPRQLPLHPQARVSEAAGVDSASCAMRIVSFSVPGALQPTMDWYYTKARTAGFTAEHQADGDAHALGGTGGAFAYMIYLSPRSDGGTDVDMVVQKAG